jgi:hypothetical protein
MMSTSTASAIEKPTLVRRRDLVNEPRTGDGAYRDRTDDLRLAKAALSQLS